MYNLREKNENLIKIRKDLQNSLNWWHLRNKGKITKSGFTLTPAEMAKKFGITTNSLLSYQTPKFEGIGDSTKEFIKDNVKKIRTIADGK